MYAEILRTIYNDRFLGKENNWSSTDLNNTLKIAKRVDQWLKSSGYIRSNGSLLDVGCATGYYTEAFRKIGYQVTGIDYSEVAIEQASATFPLCKFVHMNGFEPIFNHKFDVIFCKGFSGANTHDLQFISSWINKYMGYLNEGGRFIFSFSSDFTGKEREGETVNLTAEEIQRLAKMVNGQYKGMHFYYYFGFVSKLKKLVIQKLLKKQAKENYFVVIAR